MCFHYELEHNPTDVDEECSAGGCPSAWINPGQSAALNIIAGRPEGIPAAAPRRGRHSSKGPIATAAPSNSAT